MLAPQEAALLRALPAQEQGTAFLTYWVRKEALVKATGEGLRFGLVSFSVTGPREPPRLLAWPDEAPLSRATLIDLCPGADHVACVAVLGDVTSVVEAWMSDRLATA